MPVFHVKEHFKLLPFLCLVNYIKCDFIVDSTFDDVQII